MTIIFVQNITNQNHFGYPAFRKIILEDDPRMESRENSECLF